MKRLIMIGLIAAGVLAFPGSAGATPGPGNAPEYWFDSWKISTLWQAGARGQGITIGEVDTGVNASIAPLAGKVLKGTDFGDSGGDGRTDRDLDEFGHGTAMASIMVASPGAFGVTGIAPDAKILPIAVPLTGTSDASPDDHIAEAITWAVAHGANIINLSLGGKRSQTNDSQSCPGDEQDAIFGALRKGVIVVASIGNNGPTKNEVEEPAVCLGVISVAAVDATGTVAPFSTREPYVTVSAPGVNVPSLGRIAGNAYSGEGTSQATAIVSAVLALAWSKHRALSGRDIVTRLLATLDAPHSPPSSSYGYGIVDAYGATLGSVPASAPNPVYAAAQPFIARSDAFAVAQHAPKASINEPLGDGGYAVRQPSRISTSQVLAGLGTAGAGLVALLVLGFVGVRSMRRSRSAVPALIPPLVPAPIPPLVPTPGPPLVVQQSRPRPGAQEYPLPAQARPRPRPRPGPQPNP